MQRKNWVIPGFLVLAILLLLSFPAMALAEDIGTITQSESQPVVGDENQVTLLPAHSDAEQQKDSAPVTTVSEPATAEAPVSEPDKVDGSQPAEKPEAPVSEPGKVDGGQPADKPEVPVSEPDKADGGQPEDKPETPVSEPDKVDGSQPADKPEAPVSEPDKVDGSQPADKPEAPVSEPDKVDGSQPVEKPETPVSEPDKVDGGQPADKPEAPVSEPDKVDGGQPADKPEVPVSEPDKVDGSQPADKPEAPVSEPDKVDGIQPADDPEAPDGNPGQVEVQEPVLQPVEIEQDVPVSCPEKPANVPVVKGEVQPAPVIVVPNATGQIPVSGAPVVVVKPQTGEYAPGYVVKPGDTLQSISQKTGVSAEDLKKANGLDVSDDAVAVPRTSSVSTETLKDPGDNSVKGPTVTYKVRTGESLWLIGRSLGVPYEEIMAANHLTDHLIYPGQELIIPGIKFEGGMFRYRIKEGDTLYLIGLALGLDYEDLMSLNGLKDFWIYPDNELVIPDKNQVSLYKVKEGETLTDIIRKFNLGKEDIYGYKISRNELVEGKVLVIPQGPSVGKNMQVSSAVDLTSASDLELLARAIYAEARGEVYEGKVAVGAVILNRLKDPAFPKTIKDIIFQPRAFTSVDDGQINLTPDQESYKAAKDALNGADPSMGALYYWNPNVATSKWIWTRPIIKQIGEHVFAR